MTKTEMTQFLQLRSDYETLRREVNFEASKLLQPGVLDPLKEDPLLSQLLSFVGMLNILLDTTTKIAETYSREASSLVRQNAELTYQLRRSKIFARVKRFFSTCLATLKGIPKKTNLIFRPSRS